MGSYVFRWPYPANDVHVTGTFDDWGKSVQLNKVGDHWEREVDLPSADEKILYKFVVDDEWIVDDGAPKEGEGSYINNVLRADQIKRKSVSSVKTGDVPGAFPETPQNEPASFGVAPIPSSSGAGNPISIPAGAQVPSHRDISSNTVGSAVTTSKEDFEKAGSGDFPQTSSKEATEYSISPLPASSGAGNPISVPAGTTLPSHNDVSSKSVESAVTTSKEDYEKAGSSSAIPEAKADDPNAFSVKPIAASSGTGNPISVPAGTTLPSHNDVSSKSVESAVTTSKEDYEKAGSSSAIPEAKADDPNAFSVNPIPASSGAGNPISVPAGSDLPAGKDIHTNTIDSTVTTSKEDYEKSGSGAFPGAAIAGGAAAGVLGGAALGSAFSVPKEKTNLIPESSLPMGVGKTDTLDAGPFMSSSGPGTTTAELASKVPLEQSTGLKSVGTDAATSKLASELEVPLKNTPFMSSSGPGTTTSELAAKVPQTTDATIRSSGPGTTTSDLAAKVPVESGSTFTSSGPGTTTGALASSVPLASGATISSSGPGTTTGALAANVPVADKAVPDVVKESMSDAHRSPEAAASSEAVKEKADLEKELLSKVPTSQATGEPASAAADQTSYHGLATSVPATVEKSMQQAHAAPEAAAASSAVAEKSAMEQELLSKVPSSNEAGEPAPTLAAATSTTAPTTTSATQPTLASSTAAAATSLTDGKTANQVVPDTDTSSAARGLSAGEIAGGAAVGGVGAAGIAALATRHKDADVEPPRVADSAKPIITTEASPATATKAPGQSAATSAVTTGGAASTSGTGASTHAAVKHASDGTTTESAPVRTGASAPGVSRAAAAAVSDGTEEPTLANEPAVKMMKQNEEHGSSTAPNTNAVATAPVHDATTLKADSAKVTESTGTTGAIGKPTSTSTEAVTAPVHDATTLKANSAKVTGTAGTTGVTEKSASTSTPVAAAPVYDATTLKADPAKMTGTTGTAGATEKSTSTSEVVATAPVYDATTLKADPSKITETTVSTAEPQAPSTPAKKATPTSAASSPAASTPGSTATDKKKKKHRLSSFFKKIFD